MATLTEAQARQALALTSAFRTQQNTEAARIAALVALYYRTRVQVEDPESVQAWLDLIIPRLISISDGGARSAATYFAALRRLEVPGAAAHTAIPALGMIDTGVSKSLMAVGPGDYMNKARQIERLDLPKTRQQALLAEAKQVTAAKLAAAAVRHAQAGGRQTIYEASARDEVALGWVRVTRADPCFFCAMLASRGLRYRAFKEGAFDLSDARFSGDGDAKVHDDCGCSLKPVWADNDPAVEATQPFADLWERWGAGGGDATLRFRRGYEHWRKTGEYLSWEQANEGLRAA
jgi:hypothetical protein